MRLAKEEITLSSETESSVYGGESRPSGAKSRLILTFQEARPKDVKDIVLIYLECFPNTVRFYMGYRTCEEYFRQALQCDAFSLITAPLDGEIVGFFLFQRDLFKRMKRRKWFFKDLLEIMRLLLRHPIYAVGRLLYRIMIWLTQDARRVRRSKISEGTKGCFLDAIGVKKSARNLGIGRALLMRCVAVGKEGGRHYMDLFVKHENIIAKTLYVSAGFREVFRDKFDKTDTYRKILMNGMMK